MSRFDPRAAVRRFREREALRPDLARGLRATLAFMVPWLLGAAGWLPLNPPFVCFAANSAAFSSLQRMMGDPRNQQAGLEHAAALANGVQRLTRGFTALALQLAPDPHALLAALSTWSPAIEDSPADPRLQALRSQLARIVTELRALLLAAQASAEPLALKPAPS